MARNAFNLIVSAVAAAVVTYFTWNPSLGLAVFSLGNVALSLLNPSTPSSDLDDIRANKSAYGEFIHIPYNTVRLGGHLVWASIVRAKERGKGGFEYGQDLRYVICESPRTVYGDAPAFVTVKRIWLNKQLVFSTDENDELSSIIDIISTSVEYPIYGPLGPAGAAIGVITKRQPFPQSLPSSLQVIRIWYGEPTQMPWDVQAAASGGAENTPAYRGTIGISIGNVPLHLYGNAIPQLEVEVDIKTTGTTPDYITYDPIWEEGDPVTTDYPLGYRTMVSLFASPSYHPDTMVMHIADNEEYADSPMAVGRRSVATGEWESGTTAALIDYGDGAGNFVYDEYAPPIVWPPTASHFYTVRYKHHLTQTPDDFWWVQLSATYPFAFSKASPTPGDKGRSDLWNRLLCCSYNSAASMLVGHHAVGSGISPDIHSKFSMWAPGPNVISYFKSNDASFGGLYGSGTTATSQNKTPMGFIIDKHDHLWVFTFGQVDVAFNLYLDEYSWSVGVSEITLTHLNRYELINQDGGFNTWQYSIQGATYNEDLDEIVFHFTCSFPSATHTNRDPVAINYGGQFNTPRQYRILHWDLATRSKKMSDADSILITKASDGLLLTDFGSTTEEPFGSGVSGVLGSEMNDVGDRYIGTWTKQDYTCMVCLNEPSSFDATTDGFFVIDLDTGVATKYALWPDDLLEEINGDPDDPHPGVYTFAGAIWEPSTQCFWAGRRNQGWEAHFEGTAWYYETEGFGRYFINPGVTPLEWNLQQINEDISNRTDALSIDDDTEYDVLAPIIPKGFDIDDRRPARDAIDKLRMAYLYDIVEEDHVLRAKLRATTGDYYGRTYPGSDFQPEATIPERDVVVMENRRHFVFSDQNEQELPRWIDVKYYDINNAHQIGTEPARIGGGSPNDRNAVTLSLSVVMDSDEAATAAHRILRSTHAEKKPVSWPLSQKYLRLGPADIVVLTRNDDNFEVKIADNGIGANWALAFEAISHDSGVYSMTARGKVPDPLFQPSVYGGSGGTSGGGAGPVITIVPEPRLVVIDTGMVDEEDNDLGYFVTAIPLLSKAQGGNWTGADVQVGTASNGAFTDHGRITAGPVGGETTEALANFEDGGWDRDSILKVNVTNGKPATASEASLLANPQQSLWLVGDELLQAATAVDRGNGVFWLTNLLRGRYGTEWAIGTHEVGEAAILWDKSKFLEVTFNSSALGSTRYWRAKNDWTGLYSDVVETTLDAARLKPWAPYFIQGHYDSGGNMTGTFIARQRVPSADPLQEPEEYEAIDEYEVEIMDGATVKRTITDAASGGGSVVTAATRTFYYSAVDQLADWGSLSEGAYSVKVYKMSAVVGRGYPGEATI